LRQVGSIFSSQRSNQLLSPNQRVAQLGPSARHSNFSVCRAEWSFFQLEFPNERCPDTNHSSVFGSEVISLDVVSSVSRSDICPNAATARTLSFLIRFLLIGFLIGSFFGIASLMIASLTIGWLVIGWLVIGLLMIASLTLVSAAARFREPFRLAPSSVAPVQ
jgi:hypothetical protein